MSYKYQDDRKQFVNDYILNLRPYKPVPQEIWSVGPAERGELLKLDWNEATIEPAPEVKSAIKALITNEDFFHLYPLIQNKELLGLLSQYAGVPVGNIQYFASSDSLHEYIGRLYIKPRDKVMLLWPSYDNFRSTIEGNGAKIVYSDIGPELRFNFDKIKSDIAQETPKMVYICNPNNPVGFCLSFGQVNELVRDFPNTLFVIDEAYAEFSGVSSNSLVRTYENVLITHTMSKAFALANLRFGYLVASEDNIEAINRIRNPKNIPTITQVAVAAALKHIDYMLDYVQEVKAARELFIHLILQSEISEILSVYPSESNFVLLKCKDIETKSRIYYQLREKNIYIRQLTQSAWLLKCVRVTIGTKEQMRIVYDVMKKI